MAPFGPFVALVKGEMTLPLTAMAQNKVCPGDEMADPPGTKVFHHLETRTSVFSYTVWRAVVAAEICLESGIVRHQFCTGWSATGAGTGRDQPFCSK